MKQSIPSKTHLARLFLVPALVALSVGSAASAAFTPLKLDTVHSKVSFTAATLLFDVDGAFGDYSIEVEGDPNAPQSVKIKATISASSIDTQNTKRDDHLKSADFLDVEKHPTITFTSTNVKGEGSQLTVKGQLSIHGKSKSVSIPFKVANGKNGAGVDTRTYKGKLTIDRNDFGVGTDSIAAKISLEDEVEIKLLVVTFP